jgi:hypothetical protein
MPPVEFKPTISAGDRRQTYALESAATGTGNLAQILLLDRRYNTLRVLVRSTIVLHKFLSNTLLFQFLIFIFCKSILTSSSHLLFGLPFGLEASGFYL